MQREHTYCILSVVLALLGVIFTISGVFLQTLPLSSKSALLIFSTAFILVGACSFAVHHKKYLMIKAFVTRRVSIIAHWSYTPYSSNTLKNFIKEQKNDTLATALLVLILSLIFSIIFAYSGGPYILYLGYILAILCLLTFMLALRFISAYYAHLSSSELDVIFGEEAIYFVDELYTIQKSLHFLTKVSIYVGPEPLLILDYSLYDVDEPASYSITIPIPEGKLKVATRLKSHYTDLIRNMS